MISNEAINRAIEYILEHIQEEITIEEVAKHCNFSKYYFSRMFKQVTGESMYEYIKRVKMEQSAFRLKVEQSRTITDIGMKYGYSSSNYSSSFKQHHKLSPVEFRKNMVKNSRKNPIYVDNTIQLESFEECGAKVSVEILDDYFVLYERKIGNYMELFAGWQAFQDRYQEYLTEDTVFLERTFDDPSITDIDKCLYDICMSVTQDCTLENTCIIKGGKFAIYHFKGNVQEIYGAYQNMFQVWFANSNYKIDERYGFERYQVVDCDTMYMEIDLCIPVQ